MLNSKNDDVNGLKSLIIIFIFNMYYYYYIDILLFINVNYFNKKLSK